MFFFLNEILGLVFVVTAGAATLLMFHLWGFPWDEEELRSDAPPHLIRLHRWIGWVYVALYVYFMVQMLPRTWTYQIELPARTVAHVALGLGIGATLVVKVAIVRWFKHLESKLIPMLGTLLFIGSVLLIGLTVPFSLRELFLRQQALESGALSGQRMDRVRELLPLAGIQDSARLAELATPESLVDGRATLQNECTQCHDLRTVLARPRTPDSWRRTVRRMAQRSTVLDPITEAEEEQVTAYLIAISPTLQQTAALRRQERDAALAAATAVDAAQIEAEEMDYDPETAADLFNERCTQCHATDRVEQNPPRSLEEAADLVERMVGNGLRGSEEELAYIIRYLAETYASGASDRPAPGD